MGLRAVITAGILAAGLAFGRGEAPADTAYDCGAPENKDKPVTIEFVLAKKKQEHAAAIKDAFVSKDAAAKVRMRIFPFLDPPSNIGIGQCIPAEEGRLAIGEALRYYGKLDRLIRQDILPHHWIKVGSTDTAELAWTPVSPEDLARLTNPDLTTAQFQELYRELAAPKEKKRPFGMGPEEIKESPGVNTDTKDITTVP